MGKHDPTWKPVRTREILPTNYAETNLRAKRDAPGMPLHKWRPMTEETHRRSVLARQPVKSVSLPKLRFMDDE